MRPGPTRHVPTTRIHPDLTNAPAVGDPWDLPVEPVRSSSHTQATMHLRFRHASVPTNDAPVAPLVGLVVVV
jgi:hypothetical protein